MSQQKVEKYKKEKQNRKKIIAREKRQKALRNCAYVLVIVAFFGFIAFSIYKDYIYKEPANTEPVTYSLSEKEISKAWTEYENASSEENSSGDDENTSGEGDTTSGEDETTSGEDETTPAN